MPAKEHAVFVEDAWKAEGQLPYSHEWILQVTPEVENPKCGIWVDLPNEFDAGSLIDKLVIVQRTRKPFYTNGRKNDGRFSVWHVRIPKDLRK